MEKFLFTDGSSEVREIHSREELQALISECPRPDAIRIWVFNTNEWISYAAFTKQSPAFKKELVPVKTIPVQTVTRSSAGNRWLKKFLYLILFVAGGFLVLNFTRVRWESAGTQYISAARPGNMPKMDIDSLIWIIEQQRGQKIDRSTRNNLRLRNEWPERILLQAVCNKETSKNDGARFSGIDLNIDNTTGLQIDQAIVKLTVWKEQKITGTDTFRFDYIDYSKLAKRELTKTYRGDSLSVSFQSIRARSFNFCYSANTKNEYGDHYDKWFCKD